MRRCFETMMGLVLLGLQFLRSRFPFRRSYWDWRMDTAFGRYPVSKRARLRAILDYARWVYQMQRHRR